MKHCKSCDTTKPYSEYGPNKQSKDGYNYKCKACRAEAERIRQKTSEAKATTLAWRNKNRDKLKWIQVKANYGITKAQYDAMLVRQDYKCASCFEPTEEFHIDHDHACCDVKCKSCGKCVRALLCSRCNRGLGHFNDDVEVMKKAIAYIEKARGLENV